MLPLCLQMISVSYPAVMRVLLRNQSELSHLLEQASVSLLD
jgi:hypothetical protein